MTLHTGQPAGPVRTGFYFFVGDISVTIDARQLRFFYMKLVSNLHVVGFFYLLRSYMFVTNKAVIIHSLISKKIPGK